MTPGTDPPIPLQACLNGARLPHEHPALPVTPQHLAADAAMAAAAGVSGLHIHVKDDAGRDTLAPGPLEATLAAVRDAVHGLEVGVTTGAWALPDPRRRVTAIRSWTSLPDIASVNWHEDGADDVASALRDQGIGVEAGLWTVEAIRAWSRSPVRDACRRILVELPDVPEGEGITSLTHQMLDAVEAANPAGIPVLLHGEGRSAWAAVELAARLGVATRIGLEDTLQLPDGTRAAGNAQLIPAAQEIIEQHAAAHPLKGRGDLRA